MSKLPLTSVFRHLLPGTPFERSAINDDDLPPLSAHQALGFQFAQRAADHLADGAESRGHLLVREGNGLVAARGLIEQEFCQPAGDASQREVFNHADEHSCARGQHSHHRLRQLGVMVEQAQQRVPLDDAQRDGLHRLGAGRVGAAVEHGHVVERFARAGDVQDLLAALRRSFVDFDVAGLDAK